MRAKNATYMINWKTTW